MKTLFTAESFMALVTTMTDKPVDHFDFAHANPEEVHNLSIALRQAGTYYLSQSSDLTLTQPESFVRLDAERIAQGKLQ